MNLYYANNLLEFYIPITLTLFSTVYIITVRQGNRGEEGVEQGDTDRVCVCVGGGILIILLI